MYFVYFKNYVEQVQEGSLSSVTELPYFDGDHWPPKLEDIIMEVSQERALEQERGSPEQKTPGSSRKKVRL